MKPERALESLVAKCYLFLLPFRMPNLLAGVFGGFGAEAYYFDALFLAIGVVACVLDKGVDFVLRDDSAGRRVLGCFIQAVFVCAVLSLVMAAYVDVTYGDYNGQLSYPAVLKTLTHYLQYIVMIAYVRHVFTILSLEVILSVIHRSIVCLMLIGYIQFFVQMGVGIDGVYSFLQNTINLTPHAGYIALTTAEPSHAAIVAGAIVLPYYLSRLISENKTSFRNIFEFVLWIPLILASKSSTMYLICGIEMIVAVIWLVFVRKASIGTKAVAIVLVCMVAVVLISPEIIEGLFHNNFSYLLFTKMTDLDNQSTATRSFSLFANLLMFLRFPIAGCGNGLQGYFYPDYAYLLNGAIVDKASIELFSGTCSTIANGCTFFAGILSGWGLIGALLFSRFFFASIKTIKNRKEIFGQLYFFYVFALVGVVISGIKSDFVGLPYIWFVLALPTINFPAKAGADQSDELQDVRLGSGRTGQVKSHVGNLAACPVREAGHTGYSRDMKRMMYVKVRHLGHGRPHWYRQFIYFGAYGFDAVFRTSKTRFIYE